MTKEYYDNLASELFRLRDYYHKYLICTFGWSKWAVVATQVQKIIEG